MRDENDKGAYLPKAIKKPSDVKEQILIYRFDGLSDIISACAELAKHSFSGDSSAYATENSKYILVIKQSKENKRGASPFLLAEFGERLGAENALTLCERSAKIAGENAVMILSEL